MTRILFASAVLFSLPAVILAADKPVVWYCQTYNTPNNTRYKVDQTVDRGWSRVAESLRKHAELRVSDDPPTAQRLTGVDVVVIANPEKDAWEGGPPPRHMGEQDISALARFVVGGGSLLFASNQDWLHNIEKHHSNRLLEQFGLRMGHEDIGLKVLPLPQSIPAIGGLTWRFFFGSRIELVSPKLVGTPVKTDVWVWNDPKGKLLEGKRGSRWPLLAVAQAGKGKVLLAADIGWTANGTIGLDDNWPILWKLLDWLTPQPMGAVPPLAAGIATGQPHDPNAWARPDRPFRVRMRITSELPCTRVPMDPTIDFAGLLKQAGVSDRLDPNSIEVVNAESGQIVPHARTEDFAYSDAGRIEWVVRNPEQNRYDVYFDTADRRPPLRPAVYTPRIGVGDLLRYNAGVPRPIIPSYLSRLIDLTGDGKRDLVGCWNYAYRPGWPWDGIICFPRVGDENEFEFGDLTRIRYADTADANSFHHFSKIYMHADFADLNRDGRVDLVYSPSGGDNMISFFLNSGRRDAGGMPIFVPSGEITRQTHKWNPCRAVDLNRDGAIDIVIGKLYLRNTNPDGWPMKLAKGVTLNLGERKPAKVMLDISAMPTFRDLDGDGALDAVVLIDGTDEEPRAKHVAWQKNLGGDPPTFAPPKRLPDIDAFWCNDLAAVNDGPRQGLLVQHNVYQNVSFYEQIGRGDNPRFRLFGQARSRSAVMTLGDQAWPCLCDWDADGDLDLLIGGGYGWPRIVINQGTNEKPAYTEPRHILADGKPIRILRNQIFGTKHWHNMGYPFPVFIRWDEDELPDLLLPNETNRIFWYKNIGTPSEPRFGRRRQLLCDGYPDSPEKIAASAKLAGDKNVPNNPYPYEKDQPFFWRTGAAFADFNGDGLTDLVTHDGYHRKATLFAQYRDDDGRFRLKKVGPLKLVDGRLIDDTIVARSTHWTESFRGADWDGDGLMDLIYSCAGTETAKGSIYMLRNHGPRAEPTFEAPVTLRCFGKPIKVTSHGPHPWIGDLDNDGKPDIVTFVEWSVYPFYSHVVTEMADRPTFEWSKLQKRP